MAPITIYKICNICGDEEDDISVDIVDPSCGHGDYREEYYIWGGTKTFPTWEMAMEALNDDVIYEKGKDIQR